MPNDQIDTASANYRKGYSVGYRGGCKVRRNAQAPLTPFQEAILELAAKLPPQLVVDALTQATNGYAGHLSQQCDKFLPEGIKGDTVKAINATLDPLITKLAKRKPQQ